MTSSRVPAVEDQFPRKSSEGGASARLRAGRFPLLLILFVTSGPTITPAWAQPRGVLKTLWGKPAPTAVYLDMWTLHIFEPSRGIEHNSLIGVNVRGWYACTFINSYRVRSWGVGVERSWFTLKMKKHWSSSLGYRLGLVSGYDERLLRIAGKVPVIPIPQLVFDVAWRRAGVQVTYCWEVATAGFFVRF